MQNGEGQRTRRRGWWRRALAASLSAAAAAIAAAVAAAPLAAQQDESAFRADLQRVRATMARGEWSAARQDLLALLERFAGADCARAHRDEIVEEFKRCEFHLAHRLPRPDSLVHGDVLDYRPRSGAIKLRYDSRSLRDFQARTIDASDWLFHPVEFAGPYTVILRVVANPRRSVRLVVADTGETAILVAFGHRAPDQSSYVPMAIQRVSPRGSEPLAGPELPPQLPDRAFEVKVMVGVTTVQAYFDGALVLKAVKERDAFGRFGFARADVSEVAIEGTVTTAWLQGKVDAYMQDKRQRFDQSFDARAGLPAWLFERAPARALAGAGAPASSAPGRGKGKETTPNDEAQRKFYPGTIAPEQVQAVNRAATLTNERRFAEARRCLEAAAAAEVPLGARSYLLAICYCELGEPEEALRQCEIACREDPTFADAFVLRGRILERLRRFAAAEDDYRGAIARHPHEGLGYQALATLLCRRGDPAAAREVIAQARAAQVDVAPMAELERTLAKAERGPNWPRSFDYQSNHYHVFSDIDHETCVRAARILEQALVSYKSQLVGAPRSEQRFRLYVFSGEAGFRAYAEGLGTEVRAHTAGLYSPMVRQLLVWNLRDHAEMLETIRHEGFHQYLDSVLDDPPAWFNEGLAVYYERLPRKDGRVEGGVQRDDLLAVLRQDAARPLRLRDFLFQDVAAFYAGGKASYAQAWALIHFLREGTRAHQKLFRDVFTALREEPSQRALERAFAAIDVERLDRDFRAYLAAFGEEPAAPPRDK